MIVYILSQRNIIMLQFKKKKSVNYWMEAQS